MTLSYRHRYLFRVRGDRLCTLVQLLEGTDVFQETFVCRLCSPAKFVLDAAGVVWRQKFRFQRLLEFAPARERLAPTPAGGGACKCCGEDLLQHGGFREGLSTAVICHFLQKIYNRFRVCVPFISGHREAQTKSLRSMLA